MLLFIALCFVLTTAVMLDAVFPMRGRLGNLLGIACLIYGQIVLISEVLSERVLIGPAGFLVGQGVLFALALGWWVWRGRPDLRQNWWFGPGEIWRAAAQHRLLALFTAAVLLITAANLGLSLLYPTADDDDMTYHLPRAYFWLENGTARHYYTPDVRQTEFPPNASFTFLWMMALSGGYAGLSLPQWLAGVAAAAGAAALARAAGSRPAPALFAGLIFLTTTNGIQQMASGHNDLLTAAPAACFLFFALRFLQADDSREKYAALAYSGLAFGLLMGTKYTAFFLLPSAGLALAGYAFMRLRGRAVRAVLLLGVSAAVGFALFGAYNYVLNWRAFDNPIASEGMEMASADEGGTIKGLNDFGANVVRYLYQVMDWSILPDAADSGLFRANLAVYRTASQFLHIDPELPATFDFVETGLREPYYGASGLGAVVYVVLLLSPFVMIGLLIRRRVLLALLIAMAWGWLLVFAGAVPWSPWKPRYFHIFLPLLLAGTLPLLYSLRRRARLWLIPVMLAVLITAGWTTTVSFGRRELVRRTVADLYDPLREAGFKPDAVDLLRASLPAGATIGQAGYGTWPFQLIRNLPDFRFTYVPPDSIPAVLASGEAQAVVASASTCRRTTFAHFPLILTSHVACVFVPDPQIITDHLTMLDYQHVQTDYDQVTVLPPTAAYVDGRTLTISVPTALMPSGDVRLAVLADGTIPAVAQAACGGHPTTFEVLRSEIDLDFPPSAYDSAQPFQTCALTLAEDGALEISGVRAAPAHTPPPNEEANLRFGDDLLLVAFDLDEQQPVTACSRLYVGNWWRVLKPPSADYTITMVLADHSGVGQTRHDGPLAGYRTSRLEAGQTLLDRRFVPFPCTPSARQYDLLVGLYSSTTGKAAPIYLSDGTSVGALAYLTTITLADGSSG